MFFKTKDLMTVGNIGGGLVAMYMSMEGMDRANSPQRYLFWAGIAMLVAYTFDAFDGVVARALKQQNKFGGEFDNVADLVSYSMAPAPILYLAYRRIVFADISSTWAVVLSMLIASIPPVFGSIRFARFNTYRFSIKGFWMGFPRPASALLLIAMVNSQVFLSFKAVQYAGIAVVVLLGFMNVTLIPYIGHHDRYFTKHLKVALIYVAISVFVAFVLGLTGVIFKRAVFDLVFLYLLFYLTLTPLEIPAETRREIKAWIKSFREEV